MSKLAEWHKVMSQDNVTLAGAVDVSVHPSSQRACFPDPLLPPYRRINTEELLRDWARVPNTTWTAVGAFVCGASFTAALALRPSRSWRALVTALYSLFLVLWARLRTPRVVRANDVVDVSSSTKGPCVVTTCALSVTNSHAGTHADTPLHFSSSPEITYDPCQYTGRAIVLDVSIALRSQRTSEVSWELLEATAKTNGVDLSETFRLLLCTRPYDDADNHDEWDPNFAYITPDCARRLARLTRLFMVGIDTPSVDGPTASPLCDHAHGALYEGGVAIVENLDFTALTDSFHYQGALWGCMVTTFVPSLEFADAKGCVVTFYPYPVEQEYDD